MSQATKHLLLYWGAQLAAWTGYMGPVGAARVACRRLYYRSTAKPCCNLRSQLNPHFMFNALNGIRALIDEDPAQAKRAITQLSAILRNAMSTVKRTTVPLGEEVDIVKAYLALEAMRFEERLRVRFSIPPNWSASPCRPCCCKRWWRTPCAMASPNSPKAAISTSKCAPKKEGLRLIVRNSGHYEPGTSEGSGIGLRNTQHRLDLIYGRHADLRIVNRDGMVVTEVFLPKGSTETLSTAHQTHPSPKPYESPDHRR
jgi:two-component system LytT family sensor kinase